jgi:hypothetical protein
MKDCRDCGVNSLERSIDGYCAVCDAELCKACEREHDERHATEPDFDFDEWAESEFDEGDRFFLVPEYRQRF